MIPQHKGGVYVSVTPLERVAFPVLQKEVRQYSTPAPLQLLTYKRVA